MKTPMQLYACVVILVLFCGQLDAKRRSGGGGRIRSSGGGRRVRSDGGRNPSYPRQQWTKSADFRSPGYGTSYGTNFAGGVGRYGGKGFSKKPVGLGVGAGFIGGSARGSAKIRATYGVYHRYSQYRLMLLIHGGHSKTYRHSNHCYGNCPSFSHCEWGFCECNRGYMKLYGRCKQNWETQRARTANDAFIDCSDNSDCHKIDMNLICPANSTDNTRATNMTTITNMTENINTTNITNITKGIRKCECRKDMRWNKVNSQCQLYLDVDCSSFTYDTKPSATIIEAVKEMMAKTSGNKETETVGTTENIIEPYDYDLDDSEDDYWSTDDKSVVSEVATETPVNATISVSPNETLSNSLLSAIDPTNTTKDELREAFCRDIDSISWELSPQSSSGPRGSMVTFSGIPLQVFVFLACISYGYAILHQ